ncbi:TPA: reverse transcriptase domain-containing protein [Klebsiella aerogenes]
MRRLTDIRHDCGNSDDYEKMRQAWTWLCEQRQNAPADADVWHLRLQQMNNEAWLTELMQEVLRGDYRLSPMQLCGRGGDRKAIWGAKDALVLKWVALSLSGILPLHGSCEHVKGHGGGKRSVSKLHDFLTRVVGGHYSLSGQRDIAQKKTPDNTDPEQSVDDELREFSWVCRTDIRGYYRNINKQKLMDQVRQHVASPMLLDLVKQYVNYSVEDGGTFHTPEGGISRGCSLSPLIGAFHLYEMDVYFSTQPGIYYARYMDDVIILAKSRWSLRRHTKRLKQWFSTFDFEAHPEKTFIGRTRKGFDWMGAWLTHRGVTDIAPRAKANHRERVRRLYERLRYIPVWKRKHEAAQVNSRVSKYRKRWKIWAGGTCRNQCTQRWGMAATLILLFTQSGWGADDLRVDLTNLTDSWTPIGTIDGGQVNTTVVDTATIRNEIDWGGVCISSSPSRCSGDGRYSATLVGDRWGLRRMQDLGAGGIDGVQLAMVPEGRISINWRNFGEAYDRGVVTSFDLATGAAVYADGNTGRGCSPIEGDYGPRMSFYTRSSVSACPWHLEARKGGITRLEGIMTGNIRLTVYARRDGHVNNIGSSSDLNWPDLYWGYHTQTDSYAAITMPKRIIGINRPCSLSLGGGNSGVLDLGTINQVTAKDPSAVVASRQIPVTMTCAAGTDVVNTSMAVRLMASSELDGSVLRAHFGWGTDVPDCRVGVATSARSHEKLWGAGSTAGSYQETLNAIFCGNPQVGMGEHTIQAVIQSVVR